MKKISKAFAIILCLTIFFSGCGGKVETSEEKQTTEELNQATENAAVEVKDGKISLPFNETDGFNPFFAKSNENIYLSRLLFESLFSLDSENKVSKDLAQSITINGTRATVTIRTDADCRGSNPINAYDVEYSFNMAKASFYWSGALAGVVSATAQGNNVIDFNLEFADSLVAAKLIFPVVKSGTADTQGAIPTGSGDYYYSYGVLRSVADGEKVISLNSIDTNDSAEDGFKIGKTDVYFDDLADCEYESITGNTVDVQLNNMVYLGLNSARGALTKHIRSAIAARIDSEEIALSSYQGHATAVKLPLNPESATIKEIEAIKTKGDKDLADSIIDRCGYTRYSGKAKTNGAYLLTFTLIVNSDNRYRLAAAYNIADSLNECGFLINVQALSFEDYNQRIASGNYDMYLGEVKLDGSMDISRFFGDGALGMGIDKTEKVVTDYYKYRAGEITAQQYYQVFAEYYPFVPVCFRKGSVVYSGDITPQVDWLPFNIYAGI